MRVTYVIYLQYICITTIRHNAVQTSINQSMARLYDLEQQLMGDVDGILECFDISVPSATETLVYVDYQPNKRLRSSPNIIGNDETFDFSAPVDFDEIALAEILNDESIPLISGADEQFDDAFLQCIEKWEDIHVDDEVNTAKEPIESLLQNGKLFVPTNVDNRLSDKTASTSSIEDVRVPQPSALEFI